MKTKLLRTGLILLLSLGYLGGFAQMNGQGYANTKSNLSYFGYTFSYSYRSFMMESDIPQLSELPVIQDGGSIGVAVGDFFGALRSIIGFNFSGASVPYTMNMVEIGTSRSIYVLRLIKPKFNSFEPYLIAGLAYQRTRIFGNFLSDRANNSAGEVLMGRLGWIRASAGCGVEFQLESEDRQFIHLFAEARYGASFMHHTSGSLFNETKPADPFLIRVGVSFGKIR